MQSQSGRFWCTFNDLWKNVISRLEFRWDHEEHGLAFGGTTPGVPNRANAYMLGANVIYKF